MLCYKNSNINVVINNSTYRHLFNYLFQPQLWSIVTSGGSAFHNINITCSVTKTFSATNCLCYDTINDTMLLLLLRNHKDAFRHCKCIIPLAPPCDYSWHGTTSGPQRSWAESKRLLLARDYSWQKPNTIPHIHHQQHRCLSRANVRRQEQSIAHLRMEPAQYTIFTRFHF